MHRAARRRSRALSSLLGAGAAAQCRSARPKASAHSPGSWSATGQPETLPTEDGAHRVHRPALRVRLVLTAGSGLSRDSAARRSASTTEPRFVLVRSVWTDDRGDRIFSELQRRADSKQGGAGSGRSPAVPAATHASTGDYELTWQYVDPATERWRVPGSCSRSQGTIPPRLGAAVTTVAFDDDGS